MSCHRDNIGRYLIKFRRGQVTFTSKVWHHTFNVFDQNFRTEPKVLATGQPCSIVYSDFEIKKKTVFPFAAFVKKFHRWLQAMRGHKLLEKPESGAEIFDHSDKTRFGPVVLHLITSGLGPWWCFIIIASITA